MTVLSRIILRVMMWGSVGIGAFAAVIASVLAYALYGNDTGMSAGQHPGVGLAFLSGLALLCFALTLVVRRELKKGDGAQ